MSNDVVIVATARTLLEKPIEALITIPKPKSWLDMISGLSLIKHLLRKKV